MVDTLTPARCTITPFETPFAGVTMLRARRTGECGQLRERTVGIQLFVLRRTHLHHHIKSAHVTAVY